MRARNLLEASIGAAFTIKGSRRSVTRVSNRRDGVRLRIDLRVAWICYQCPVFGMDAQGSVGASASPFCSSSIEILSGERTNAM